MQFPGHRNPKYYFPVTGKCTAVSATSESAVHPWYVVGLDEMLVDLEVHGCSVEFVRELGFLPGESVQVPADHLGGLLDKVRRSGLPWRYAAGGTVANTLANFTHLAGEPAVLLGAIEDSIRPGSAAFAYVAQTPKAVSLEHLLGLPGHIGLAITCFTPDGERSFGVAPGISGDYTAAAVPSEVVQGAAVALTTAYLIADESRPICEAAYHMMELARGAGVPVAFGLGTAGLVRRHRERIISILKEYVTIAAMNAAEAEALTGETDALLACRKLLDWVDMGVVTEGARGVTLCGYTDDAVKRQTRDGVRSKSIPEYNLFEFSRLVRREDCANPLPVYTHIHPFRGGPDKLRNTSGAGDAALAAVLHDVAANTYHRDQVPGSKKHSSDLEFLTYSSLSRTAQYANRVAYEVLCKRSPRLDGPVGPDDSDSE